VVGKQLTFYSDYIRIFPASLLCKDFERAATYAYAAYLVRKHGKFQRDKSYEITEEEYGKFPLFGKKIDSNCLEKTYATDPFVLLWTPLYKMARNKRMVNKKEVLERFKKCRNAEEKLDYLFRLMVVFQRGCSTELPLSLKPTISYAQAKAKIIIQYKRRSDISNNALEKTVYDLGMKDIHPEKGSICFDTRYYGKRALSTLERLEDLLLEQEREALSEPEVPIGQKRKQTEKPKEPEKKKTKKYIDMPQDFDFSSLLHVNVRDDKIKKFNVVSNGSVFKGPYQDLRFRKTLDVLKFIDSHCSVSLVLPTEYRKDPKSDKFYLEFPNLAVTPKEQWKTSKMEDVDKSNLQSFEVVDSVSMGIKQYSQLIFEDQETFVNHHYLPIVKTFMWLALLHVADRDLSNVLVINEKLYFVDFDQTHKKDPLRKLNEDKIIPDFAFSKGIQAFVNQCISKGIVTRESAKEQTKKLEKAFADGFAANQKQLQEELKVMEHLLGLEDASGKPEELTEIVEKTQFGKLLSDAKVDLKSVIDTFDVMFANVNIEI